ncbi:VOC family protein [Demequina soli]|uniref:VOC family protein n=1 Tax=Demequina soli TaxID=1638987 RepID=UPI0007848AE3|nr:VOC family protein [Demequina soli]
MGVLSWFEIPASDLARATAFYEAVLGVALVPEDIGDGMPKSLIPDGGRMVGSVAFGSDWKPSATGPVLYLDGGEDLQEMLDRAVAAGGTVVEPKQPVDATSGFWARFRDTEGNILGVLSPR